jgi:hypothetical protein
MREFGTLILCISLFVSCDYLKQDPEKTPIARANDSYLFADDIKELVPDGTSQEDSTLIVNNYINRWATQQLLISGAQVNLTEEKLAAFEKLTQDYKNALYTEAYKSAIVSKQLDSTITELEFAEFYEKNSSNFKLKEELLKVRYIVVDENYSNIENAKQLLNRFNEKDIDKLNTLSIKFKKYNLNDSVWVKKEALLATLPILNDKDEQLLKKSNFAQLQDSLGVYLVKIEDVLLPNDTAPFSYVEPTIRQIILNKRKLELIKKLEKDITKDAIKNKNFEIYPTH